jgi:hypothetical protein
MFLTGFNKNIVKKNLQVERIFNIFLITVVALAFICWICVILLVW